MAWRDIYCFYVIGKTCSKKLHFYEFLLTPSPPTPWSKLSTQQLVPSESVSSIQSQRNRASYCVTTTPREGSASTKLYESLGFPELKIDPFTISTLNVTQSLAEDEVGICTSPNRFDRLSHWPRQLVVGDALFEQAHTSRARVQIPPGAPDFFFFCFFIMFMRR